jgi:hypothetical protein
MYASRRKPGGGYATDPDETDLDDSVGLYRLNPVDPVLESAWFQQPLILKYDILVSKFAFKWVNLYRCNSDSDLANHEVVPPPAPAPAPAPPPVVGRCTLNSFDP